MNSTSLLPDIGQDTESRFVVTSGELLKTAALTLERQVVQTTCLQPFSFLVEHLLINYKQYLIVKMKEEFSEFPLFFRKNVHHRKFDSR